jgi:plasmid stability protein
MAQLLVRGLDERELARLKELARENERSLEAEARMALKKWLSQPTSAERATSRAEFREWAARMRSELVGRWQDDSTEMIRDDREQR